MKVGKRPIAPWWKTASLVRHMRRFMRFSLARVKSQVDSAERARFFLARNSQNLIAITSDGNLHLEIVTLLYLRAEIAAITDLRYKFVIAIAKIAMWLQSGQALGPLVSKIRRKHGSGTQDRKCHFAFRRVLGPCSLPRWWGERTLLPILGRWRLDAEQHQRAPQKYLASQSKTSKPHFLCGVSVSASSVSCGIFSTSRASLLFLRCSWNDLENVLQNKPKEPFWGYS